MLLTVRNCFGTQRGGICVYIYTSPTTSTSTTSTTGGGGTGGVPS